MPKKVVSFDPEADDFGGDLSISIPIPDFLSKKLEYEPDEVLNAHGFYYDLLDEDAKVLYDEIYIIFRDRLEDEKVSSINTGMIEAAANAVLYDHPELFYVENYKYAIYKVNDAVKSVAVNGIYLYDEYETAFRKEKIDNYVKRVFDEIKTNDSDYEKAKKVYEYIIDHTEYLLNADDNQNICSVCINGVSVCNGYAKTFQYIMNLMSLECTTVLGFSSDNGTPHAWNLLKADGEWYNVDVTWGDASFREDNEYTDLMGSINYDYFMVPDKWIVRNHVFDETFDYPECTAIEDNYYVKTDTYLESVDIGKLTALFAKGYATKASTVCFAAANEEVFTELKNYLIKGSKIFDFLQDVKTVRYVANPDTLTFIVLLKDV